MYFCRYYHHSVSCETKLRFLSCQIGSPILGIQPFPRLEDQIQRYLTLGWEKCQVTGSSILYPDSCEQCYGSASFDADPDSDPTFHFNADPDPTPSFTHVKNKFFFNFYSLQWQFFFLISKVYLYFWLKLMQIRIRIRQKDADPTGSGSTTLDYWDLLLACFLNDISYPPPPSIAYCAVQLPG